MYIQPNTNIRLLSNCPIDNTYSDTLYFSNTTAQYNYFSGLTKYNLSQNSYTRHSNGIIRVPFNCENLYDCNYCMFQNASFGQKWFYAFINNVEYVNDNLSLVYFEIDVMQSWFFDYTLMESFVAREHTETDYIGDNLVPESVELGEYIMKDFMGTGHLQSYSIIVASTFNTNLDDTSGAYYSGIYSGVTLLAFTNADDANDFLLKATAANLSDGIVGVYMVPSDFIRPAGQSVASYSLSFDKNYGSLGGGYVPKNNKLFTYPYNFLYCTDLNGNSAEFRYEDFSSSDCEFNLSGDMSPNMSIILTPQNYKGVLGNYNEKMVISGFPQCSFNIDSYKAYMAQNSVTTEGNIAGGFVASALAIAGAVATGGALAPLAVGAVGNFAGTIASYVSGSVKAQSMPNQARGGGGSSALVANHIKDFAFAHMCIKSEFAQIIDDYFDLFGYATNKVKVPNRNARPHWTYTKTVGCKAVGSVPSDDMRKIKSIYDAGITFWMSGLEVGQYYLDNRASERG